VHILFLFTMQHDFTVFLCLICILPQLLVQFAALLISTIAYCVGVVVFTSDVAKFIDDDDGRLALDVRPRSVTQ